ncbi:urease accessory protein UreF [Aspergillus ellipticus CBS 707.79]|uniref:Urease accessory protein UreF n=1 Tax=Aspergillus ellipticus CBS 707.79 TaxID=1448320 RepID=A0A319CUU8_9EURO|nr:urease accessory protein UreF [Aspergillus ellipticus CBS 707.79]
MTVKTTVQDLQQEIADLEARLRDARSRLALASASPPDGGDSSYLPLPKDTIPLVPTHALLLLSDSALPLGSFAYSSGLESYLAHNKPLPRSVTSIVSFHRFLKLSIASMASTSIPYVLAGYWCPADLETLDNDLDASTPCIVAQRASLAQGRALLGVWERAFRGTYAASPFLAGSAAAKAVKMIESFSDALKSCLDTVDELGPKGHFAPLWGVVCLAMGMDARQTAYVFMLNHAKAVLSAAVRASVMGPYQAQNVLASRSLQAMITQRIDREWDTPVEDAGQIVPPLDLWVGRHELLYSRIFNS